MSFTDKAVHVFLDIALLSTMNRMSVRSVMHIDLLVVVWRSGSALDYVSSCGIRLMPMMYQVVGFGRANGRHSGRHGWSVV